MKLSKIHVLLFILTVITTFVSGYLQGGSVLSGISFSLALLLILGAHEMGHYYYGRKNGISITPPYFIPAPPFISPIGTFGAFIKIKSRITDKLALFDIGVAGPIWGMVVAIPVLILGLMLSEVIDLSSEEYQNGVKLGSSLIFISLVQLVIGSIPEGKDLLLHPVAFAGWIGLLVTSLNLIPSGQLDGGHIVYSVFSKTVHKIFSIISMVVLVFLGMGTKPIFDFMESQNIDMLMFNAFNFEGWLGWLLWAFFLIVLGAKHPSTQYETIKLDRNRLIIALLSLLILIGCFSPIPVKI